jgi:hypothetical protein
LFPDPQHLQGHAPPPLALGDGEKALGEQEAPGRGEQVIGDIATGQVEDRIPRDGKNSAATALGKLGASKGGNARAKRLTSERRYEIARKAATNIRGGSGISSHSCLRLCSRVRCHDQRFLGTRFAADSAQEGDGFEPSVPRKAPDTDAFKRRCSAPVCGCRACSLGASNDSRR